MPSDNVLPAKTLVVNCTQGGDGGTAATVAMVLCVLPMECRLSFRKLRWASCRRSIYVICFRRVSKPITQKLQSSFTPGAPFAARVNTVLTPSHWAWHLRKRPRNPLAAKWAPCSTFLTGTFCAEGMPQFGQRVRLMKEC